MRDYFEMDVPQEIEVLGHWTSTEAEENLEPVLP